MRSALLAIAGLACAAACSAEPDPPDPQKPGTIATIAGSGEAAFDGDGKLALESGLYAPVQVFFSPDSERVSIVDWNNHRVREIQDDGTLKTTIGTGVEMTGGTNGPSNEFPIHHPMHFQRAPNGELFFAGYHDPRVLRVESTSYVRVFAGFGLPGRTGDGGPADLAFLVLPSGIAIAADQTVYIADEEAHVIRRVDPAGIIHHFAGTGEPGFSGDDGPAATAALNQPSRLALDADGNLLLCDTGNHRLRMIDQNGVITTIAGTGVPGFEGEGGLAKEAQLHTPMDVIVLEDRSILIADTLNHSIRRIDAETKNIEVVVGTGVGGFSGDGDKPKEAQLTAPQGIVLDAEKNLWIADTYNHRVRKILAPVFD